ncbi:hypothetical protein LINPERPRIM_LOCUS28626 [Linum perenne]
MGEIDTSRPIESVKLAVSLLQDRHKSDHHNSASSEKGTTKGLLKELASYKIQLQAKDYEQLVLLRKLDQLSYELKSTQGEMLNVQAELLALKDENREVLARADSERRRVEELERVRFELEKELGSAMCKVGEMRGKAEQAATRADVADRGKVEAEMELKRLREKKQKRKSALVALREESSTLPGKLLISDTVLPSYSKSVESYQPLGKLLNFTY